MIKNFSNNFLNKFMLVIFIFSILSSILINFVVNFAVYIEVPKGMKLFANIIFISIILLGFISAYFKRYKILTCFQKLLTIKNLIVWVIIISFIIRFLWIVLIKTIPISDFEIMYSSSKEVFAGNFNCFHDSNYFARFTHDTIPVLYYSLFFNFNNDPIFIIKLFNVFFSTLSIFIMYSIVKLLLGSKSAVLSAIILSLFPPFILYNSQILSENIAMPFYLISIYFFIKYTKNMNKSTLLIFSGLALSVGNLFRMVGIIFLIAYIIYFIIYIGFKSSLKPILLVIVMFALPLYITSTLLINNGITQSNLWSPKETFLTSVLKGTNLNSFGFWNEEDSKIPMKYNYDYNEVKRESLKLIKQRLTDSPIHSIFTLYIGKLSGELGVSDFGSFKFTVISASETPMSRLLQYFEFALLTLMNIYHVFLLYFCIFSVHKSKNLLDELNLFLIISIGFILFYLISEVQPRYSFIYCWTLVILAVSGLKMKFQIISQESTVSYLSNFASLN